MYEFVRGPMVWISIAICILGLAYQFYKLMIITKKKDKKIYFTEEDDAKKSLPEKVNKIIRKLIPGFKIRGTVLEKQTVMSILSLMLHLLIIIMPLFVLGHNILLFESWRLNLPSLPEMTTDIFTLIFLACAVIFLLRRIFVPRIRAVTSIYDYLILLITIGPFLTGYMAYHQLVDYETIITLHILSGELMLIAVGITKLGHMMFFFFVRFHIGNEYSFKSGTRKW